MPVVARSPDRATRPDRRSLSPCKGNGDLRSRLVARSGDRATTGSFAPATPREAELPGHVFPSGAWERGAVHFVSFFSVSAFDGRLGMAPSFGATLAPGRARLTPSTMTHSSPFKPASI